MKFCIVVIARNESANICKMAESAKDYLDAGGKIYLLDTGSTDNTVEVARNLGFNVTVSKTNFHKTLTQKILNSWRKRQKISCIPLTAPITFFCFDLARNAASQIPKEDIMFFADGCDHFLSLDYSRINALIEEGRDNFSIIQKYGAEKGRINRFYNRKTGKWVGHVHEFLECKGYYFHNLDEDIMSIEHKYVEKDRADKYMAGLIATHEMYPSDEYGRWYHYIARELMFRKHYSDARRLFQKRANLLYYPEEGASSLCMSAKCCKSEGGTEEEIISYYEKAYDMKTTLCEPLFEICEYSFKKENWVRVLKVATECLELIKNHSCIFFEEERFTKKENLYWYLYHGHWWAGEKDMAMYYWRCFSKSRGIIEEKHEYWKFLHKYRYFPDVPYKISEFEYSKEDEGEIYKCITTIEEDAPEFFQDEKISMKLTRKFLPPCVSVIDSPAEKGFFSIAMSKSVFPNTVHAFEVRNFKHLNTNAFLNGRENIKTRENILSDQKGYFSENNDEIENLLDVSTIDSFDIREVGFIKLGIQNQNYDILGAVKGSLKTIKKCEPTLLISHPLDSETENNLDSIASDLNYTKMKLKNMIFYIPEKIKNKKRVAIVCYPFGIKWDGTQNNNKYIEFGESEQAVINLANSLVRSGIQVDVWGIPTKKFTYEDNPRYLDYKNFHSFNYSSEYYHSIIYWRFEKEIKTKKPCTKNILWLQDFVDPDIDEKLVDNVVFLSESHQNKTLVNKKYAEKISFIIPNCIDVVKTNSVPKIDFRCVYLNNHAYGLDLLLDSWEKIQEKFNDASLHILHGSQTWGIKTKDEEKSLKDRISSMKSKNVVLHHTLNQNKLQEELEKASFWLYPCAYEEPYCIQGIQAACAGVIPIVSDQVFLKKLTPERCVIWPLDCNIFAQKCIEIMSLDSEILDSIKKDVMSRGNSLFCDSEKCSKLFTDMMFG